MKTVITELIGDVFFVGTLQLCAGVMSLAQSFDPPVAVQELAELSESIAFKRQQLDAVSRSRDGLVADIRTARVALAKTRTSGARRAAEEARLGEALVASRNRLKDTH